MKLQEILASNSAIHSNLKAQTDATEAKIDGLQSELAMKNAALAAAQSQEHILKAELRQAHAMQRESREAFDTISQHAATSSQNMQEMMHAFFNGFDTLAAQARDAMLALMLSYDAEVSLDIPYHQIRFDTFTSKALELEKDKNIEVMDDQKMRCSSAPPQFTTLAEMPQS
jgi:predicted transcriptional regulator